jgi:hypothetical protein
MIRNGRALESGRVPHLHGPVPVAVAGGILLSIAAGCGGSSDQQASEGTSTLGVTVHVSKRETLRDVATASGIVVPSAAGDWLVTAPDVAEIAELTRVQGETVKTGDVLVRFEIASRTQELAVLQLEALAAEQAVERARAELTRQTALSERGLIARSAFKHARSCRSPRTSFGWRRSDSRARGRAKTCRSCVRGSPAPSSRSSMPRARWSRVRPIRCSGWSTRLAFSLDSVAGRADRSRDAQPDRHGSRNCRRDR